MSPSVFSTYRQGENRVTSTITAVLRSLALSRIEHVLGALMERSEFQLVRFENQASKGGKGVPDAAIHASCRILVETKTTRGAVNVAQLTGHLKKLESAAELNKVLLVLTPDATKPEKIRALNSSHLVWCSFASFDQAIEELLLDAGQVVSEREAFLLQELRAMFREDGLIDSDKNVVVVPARDAWREYNTYAAYVCQPRRTFQNVRRIGFYIDGEIQTRIPSIEASHDEVQFVRGAHAGKLGAIVDRMLDDRVRQAGDVYKVLVLSAHDDVKSTERLERPIPNDLISKSGRPTAFTQYQRYVALDDLKRATTTSDLVRT